MEIVMTTRETQAISQTNQARRHAMLLVVSVLALLLAVIAVPRSFALEPAAAPPAKTAPAAAKAASTQSATLNINTADAAALAAGLVGVGPAKADAIVAYRTEKGKFTSIDQLLDVKGIGQATLEKNREKISL